jgi:hypothetical protein
MPSNDLSGQMLADYGNKLRGNTVIIFIPSHDKKVKELRDQDVWAAEAVDLFAKVFGGATGFQNLLGTWFDPEQDKVLPDSPIMIQSLVKEEKLTEANLKRVLEFGRRMGRETNQACVGVVVNDVMYELLDFSGE